MKIVDLNAFDLIAIEGEDSKKFLQGQVTCDIARLSPAQSIEGAICNIKGRVISNFRLLEFHNTCYLLLAEGMAAIVKPVLDKYMVFSRAESKIATDELTRTGLLGAPDPAGFESLFSELPAQAGGVALAEQAALIRIAGQQPRYELWSLNRSGSGPAELPDSIAVSSQTAPSEAWVLADILVGSAHITPALSEQHLPEALNYDLSGLISFTKGCYTGQEIVARMHYRGTAKKRLYSGVCRTAGKRPTLLHYKLPGEEAVAAGELLASAANEDGDWYVMGVLPTAIEESGAALFLDNDAGLTVELLPAPDRSQ